VRNEGPMSQPGTAGRRVAARRYRLALPAALALAALGATDSALAQSSAVPQAAAQPPQAGDAQARSGQVETLPTETQPPKPTVQSIGRSGPTQYERDDLKIYGVDDRIRRLGETQFKSGQESTPTPNSGRNCGRFSTSVVCD